MEDELLEHLHNIEQLMTDGDMDTALKMLQELSIEYPDNYHVMSLLGECFLTMGEPDKAIKPLKWATKKFEETEPSEKMKTSEDLEKDLIMKLKKKFTDKKKNNAWVDHYLLGCAYGRCLKFQSAIKHLNIADKMNPENAEVIRNMGWIRCMQERKADGRKLLEHAIQLDPDNALAYNDLGASYMFDEDFEQARQWIAKATEMDPDDEFIISTSDKLEELIAYKTIFGKIPKEK